MRRSPVRIINDTRIYWILIYIQCSPQVCISWQNVVHFPVRKTVFLCFLEPLRHFEPFATHLFVCTTPCSGSWSVTFHMRACHFKGKTVVTLHITHVSYRSIKGFSIQYPVGSSHLPEIHFTPRFWPITVWHVWGWVGVCMNLACNKTGVMPSSVSHSPCYSSLCCASM